MQRPEDWVKELREAGWTAVRIFHHPSRIEAVDHVTTLWRAPSGAIYRGPYGAWRQMKLGAE